MGIILAISLLVILVPGVTHRFTTKATIRSVPVAQKMVKRHFEMMGVVWGLIVIVVSMGVLFRNVKRSGNGKGLSLFSVMQEFDEFYEDKDPAMYWIHRNAIHSWTLLSNSPEIIVFVQDEYSQHYLMDLFPNIRAFTYTKCVSETSVSVQCLWNFTKTLASNELVAYVNPSVYLSDDVFSIIPAFPSNTVAIGKQYEYYEPYHNQLDPNDASWYSKVAHNASYFGQHLYTIDYMFYSKSAFHPTMISIETMITFTSHIAWTYSLLGDVLSNSSLEVVDVSECFSPSKQYHVSSFPLLSRRDRQNMYSKMPFAHSKLDKSCALVRNDNKHLAIISQLVYLSKPGSRLLVMVSNVKTLEFTKQWICSHSPHSSTLVVLTSDKNSFQVLSALCKERRNIHTFHVDPDTMISSLLYLHVEVVLVSPLSIWVDSPLEYLFESPKHSIMSIFAQDEMKLLKIEGSLKGQWFFFFLSQFRKRFAKEDGLPRGHWHVSHLAVQVLSHAFPFECSYSELDSKQIQPISGLLSSSVRSDTTLVNLKGKSEEIFQLRNKGLWKVHDSVCEV